LLFLLVWHPPPDYNGGASLTFADAMPAALLLLDEAPPGEFDNVVILSGGRECFPS
jgi:hypothetical protein